MAHVHGFERLICAIHIWQTHGQASIKKWNCKITGIAGFVTGALAEQAVDAAYLSVGQLGLHPRSYLLDYWTETVRAVGARRVVPIHWDDFFRPLSKPLRALPYAGDDLNASMRILDELAAQDGVALDMPTVWQREDPWA